MPKVILSLDGGGIRGAATTRFLARLEELLNSEEYGTSIRETVDLHAGTSTGSIIALALATTELTVGEIDSLYNPTNAEKIFVDNRGWFEIDGINAPKYEGNGKTELLMEKLGERTRIGDVPEDKHVLVVTYCVNTRRPVVVKSDGEPAPGPPVVPGGGRLERRTDLLPDGRHEDFRAAPRRAAGRWTG